MRIGISGAGWVTPLGRGLDEVTEAIVAGKTPPQHTLGEEGFPAYLVDGALVGDAAAHPRLRRSGRISHLAVAAARDAIANAGERNIDAVLFATTDGGVCHTKKFFAGVEATGSGSPLLFPETVYNAPASHIAAVTGITGAVDTLVGDNSAGLSAVSAAIQLIQGQFARNVLVVAANECDAMSCAAYTAWGIVGHPLVFSEGAAAVVLSADASHEIDVCTEVPQSSCSNVELARQISRNNCVSGYFVAKSSHGMPEPLTHFDFLGEGMAFTSLAALVLCRQTQKNTVLASGFLGSSCAIRLTRNPET